MAFSMSKIPDSVAHLDLAVVAETLVKHGANVRNAAQELGVPTSDLRQLTLVNQALINAAYEAEELRLDRAEAMVDEALKSNDSRRSDAAAYFVLRNSAKARRRGWITSSSSTVDLNVTTNNSSQTIIYRWRNENDPDPNPEETERLRQERWGDKPLIEHEALTKK
jgi:hypothetical protein